MNHTFSIFAFIPFLFFSTLLWISTKRRGISFIRQGQIRRISNYLPILIIGVYFLSSLSTLFIDPTILYPYFHSSSYTVANSLIYALILSFFLIPSFNLKPLFSAGEIPKTRFLNFIISIMAILAWYSVIYQLPYAIKSYYMGANVVRLSLAYDGYQVLPNSIFTSLAVAISYFNIFYMVLFFIAIQNKKSFFIKLSMFLGSLSYVVSGLAFAARDCTVFFILNFIFTYCFFKNSIDLKHLFRIKKLYSGIILFLVFIFTIFTFQRFSDRESSAISYGVIGYLGQQPFVFSEAIEKHKDFYQGNLRFPIFTEIVSDRFDIIRTNHYEWMFGTFIKDFYSEGGYVFLLITMFILIPFFWFKLKKQEINFYRKIIVIFIYFQFMTQGIFYFRMGERAGNYYLLILLTIYLLTYIHDFVLLRISPR